MTYYKVNGKRYNIPTEHKAGFEKANPEAKQMYASGDSIFSVPLSDRSNFEKYNPGAVEWVKPQVAEVAPVVQEVAPVDVAAPAAPSAPSVAEIEAGDTPIQEVESAPLTIGSLNVDEALAAQESAPKEEPKKDRLLGEGKIGLPAETMRMDVAEAMQAPAQAVESVDTSIAPSNLAEVTQELPEKFAVTNYEERLEDIDSLRGEINEVEEGIMREQANNMVVAPGNFTSVGSAEGRSALRILNDTEEIINQAKKNKDGATGTGNFFRGLRDEGFDITTWDFGVSDLVQSLEVREALDKSEKGQELTAEENLLLDALVTNIETKMTFANDLGKGYKYGSTTAQSLPFMMEMAINPLSGLGKSLGRGFANHIARKAAAEGIELGAKSLAQRAAQTGVRVAGDVAGAAGMAATTGSVRVAEDFIRRTDGDLMLGEAEDGTMQVVRGEGIGSAEAAAKAVGSLAIQNFSEMLGQYFSPIGKAIGGSAVGKAVAGSKVGQAVGKINKSDAARKLAEFEQKVQWNGTFGEYAEEMANNVMDAAIIGDMTWEDVADKENLVDTFVSVAIMGGFFSTVRTASYAAEKAGIINRVEAATQAVSNAFPGDGSDVGAEVNELIAGSTEETLAENTMQAMDMAETQEQRQAVLGASQAKGAELGSEQNEAEDVQSEHAAERVQYEAGKAATEEQYEAQATEMLILANELGAPLMDEYRASSSMDEIVSTYPEKEAEIRAYHDKLQFVRGYEDGQMSQKTAAQNAVNEEVDSRTNKESGMIISGRMKGTDTDVHIVGGHVEYNDNGTLNSSESSDALVVRYEDGRTEMVPSSDIASLQPAVSAQQTKDDAWEPLYQQYTAPMTAAFNRAEASAQAMAAQVTPVQNEVAEAPVPSAPIAESTPVSEEIAEFQADPLEVFEPQDLGNGTSVVYNAQTGEYEIVENAPTAESVEVDAMGEESTYDVDEDVPFRLGSGRDAVDGSQARDYDAIEAAAREFAEQLNTDIYVIREPSDISDNDEYAQQKRESRGWFVPSTGKVEVVIYNHSSIQDVRETILHEIVGHKGVKSIMGDKYNDFLDKVWDSLHHNTRKRLIKAYGTNTRECADEYIAEMAEADVESSAWRKFVAMFREFVREVFGIDLKITDSEIQEVLYRSKVALQSANAKNNVPGKEYDIYDDFSESPLFRVGNKKRAEYKARLIKNRPDLDAAEVDAFIEYLDTLDDNKRELATFTWFMKGVVRVPEDQAKIDQAIKVAAVNKVDPVSFASPMEVINTFGEIKGRGNLIDPDTVSTLSNKKDYGDGITVYNVENDVYGQEDMREILNSHFGKNSSPWCLLQGDSEGSLTEDSMSYWNHYNAIPKRVAFQNGKLVAFSASEEAEMQWWDRFNRASDGIPILKKMPQLEKGAVAVYEYAEKYDPSTQEVTPIGFSDSYVTATKGDKKNGEYKTWFPNGQLETEGYYKDGEGHGKFVVYSEDGVVLREGLFKNGEKQGYFVLRHKNGNLYQEATYVNNEPVGETKEYDEAGRLRKIVAYNNSSQVYDRRTYYPSGILQSRVSEQSFSDYEKTNYFESGSLKNYEQVKDYKSVADYRYLSDGGLENISEMSQEGDDRLTVWYADGNMFRLQDKERDTEVMLYDDGSLGSVTMYRYSMDIIEREVRYWRSGAKQRDVIVVNQDRSGLTYGEHENGVRAFEEYYNAGEAVGVWKMYSEDGTEVSSVDYGGEVPDIVTPDVDGYNIPMERVEQIIANATKVKSDLEASREDIRFRQGITNEEAGIIDEAKANGTYMKAPNGEDTNLDEKQWAQVRTRAFVEWFGDWENNPSEASKVLDENGEPLVMYHGSVEEFYTFDKDRASVEGNLGASFYFTSDYTDVSENYEGGGPDFDMKVNKRASELQGENEDMDWGDAHQQALEELYKEEYMAEVYLRVKNPVYIGGDTPTNVGIESVYSEYIGGEIADREENEDEYYEQMEEAMEYIAEVIFQATVNSGGDSTDAMQASQAMFELTDGFSYEGLRKAILGQVELIQGEDGSIIGSEVVRRVFEELGYDGIIDNTVSEKFQRMEMESDTMHIAVFDNRDIKSATDNDGSFGDGGDIRFRKSSDGVLVGLHNISESKMLSAMRMGGLANPSFAVTDPNVFNHDGFGDITFIAPKDLIDSKAGRNAGTWFSDAYTPRYPNITILLGKGSYKTLMAEAEGLPEDMKRDIAGRVESAAEDGIDRMLRTNEAMMLFANKKGMVEEIMYKPKYPLEWTEKDYISGIDPYSYSYVLTEEQKNEVKEMYREYGNSEIERIIGEREIDKFSNGARRIIDVYFNEDGSVDDSSNSFNNFIRSLSDEKRKVGKIDKAAMLRESIDPIYTAEIGSELRNEYESYVQGLYESLEPIEKIFMGYTPSGNRKYKDHTLENVSAIMKAEGRAGQEGAHYGMGTTRALLLEKSGNLKKIRKASTRIVDQEEFDAAKARMAKRYTDAILLMGEDYSAEYRLDEVLAERDMQGYAKKEYDIDLSDADVAFLKDFKEDLMNMETTYFETKFERPVYVSEFAGAVIPETTDERIKEYLTEQGVEYVEYGEGNREEETSKFIDKLDESGDIRFRAAVPRKKGGGRYSALLKKLGDPVSLEEVILRDIIGGMKFSWGDKGKNKGVARELGFASESRFNNKTYKAEKQSRRGMLANNGITPDLYAHNLWMDYSTENGGSDAMFNMDDMEMKDVVLDVLQNVTGVVSAAERLKELRSETLEAIEEARPRRLTKDEVIGELKLKVRDLAKAKRKVDRALVKMEEKGGDTQAKVADLQQAIRQFNISQRVARSYIRENITADIADAIGKSALMRLTSALSAARTPESTLESIQEILRVATETKLKLAEAKNKDLLDFKRQGQTQAGVSIAKMVDNRVRNILDFINQNRYRDMESVRSSIVENERIGVGADQTADQHTATYILGLLQLTDSTRADFEDMQREQKRLLNEAKALGSENYKISRSDDKTEADKAKYTANRERAKALRSMAESMEVPLQEARELLLSQVDGINEVLSELIADGRSSYLDWVQSQEQRRKDILNGALHDIGRDRVMESIGQEWEPRNALERVSQMANSILAAGLQSIEYQIKKATRTKMNGEGNMYDQFIRGRSGYLSAADNYFIGLGEYVDALGSAAEEIFGFRVLNNKADSFAKVISLSRKAVKGLAITTRDENSGKEQEIPLTVGQAMYIRAAAKQSDGAMKLERMGIREEHVEAINDFLSESYPQMLEFAEWAQGTFLPLVRSKYNATHLEVMGTEMRTIDNYFPLVIDKSQLYIENDGTNKGTMLPTSITGSIINRSINVSPIDLKADFFEVLMDHGTQMEHWNAYTQVIKDMNGLTSSPIFKKALNYKQIGGASQFMKAASVAAEQYSEEVGIAQQVVAKLTQTVAYAKISYRMMTAIKQILGMPAFNFYSASPKFQALFIKEVAQMPIVMAKQGSYKWALANLPNFEKRVSRGTSGNDVLEKEGFKYSAKINKFVKAGMWANSYMDAIACAVGSKAVYDFKKEYYTKRGYTKQEAEESAKKDAVIAYNTSQQSADGTFISALQKNRNIGALILTVFLNAPIAYQRNVVNAIQQLRRNVGEQKKNIVRDLVARGIDRDTAEKQATKDVFTANSTSILRVVGYGFVVSFLWQLGSTALPYIMGAADDEDDLFKETIMNPGTWMGFFQGYAGVSVATSVMQGYRFNPSILFGEIEMLLRDFKNTDLKSNAEVGYLTLDLMSTFGLKQDITTFANMYKGVTSIYEGNTAQGIAEVLNAPKSQIKKIAANSYKGDSLSNLVDMAEFFKALETGEVEMPEFPEIDDAAFDSLMNEIKE